MEFYLLLAVKFKTSFVLTITFHLSNRYSLIYNCFVKCDNPIITLSTDDKFKNKSFACNQGNIHFVYWIGTILYHIWNIFIVLKLVFLWDLRLLERLHSSCCYWVFFFKDFWGLFCSILMALGFGVHYQKGHVLPWIRVCNL